MSYKQGDLIKNDSQSPLPLVNEGATPPAAGTPLGISNSPPVLRHLIPGTNSYFPDNYPGIIDAAGNHYNEFLAIVKEVYSDLHTGAASTTQKADYGYGKALDSSYVNVNDNGIIYNDAWNRLFGLMILLSKHQGTSLGDTPSSVNVGEIIDAKENATTGLEHILQNLVANRFKVDAIESTITDKLSTSNVTLNTGNSVHNVRVRFPTWNSARYFFNSGGAIRFSAVGADTWASSITGMGVINFRAVDTLIGGSGVTNTSKGFYNLTTNNLEIANIPITGQTGSYYSINARLAQAPGSGSPEVVIFFSITFHNALAPVAGTFISRVAELRSAGVIPYTDTVIFEQDQVSEDLNISATSGTLYGERSGTGSVSTNTTTVSTTGGTAPYTYTWTTLSGKTGITIVPSTGATVRVDDPSVSAGSTNTGTIRCTVVDSSVPAKTTVKDIPWSTKAYSSMSVSITPSSVNQTIQGSGLGSYGPVTASVSGGSGGYTYQWTSTGNGYINGSTTNSSVTVQASLTAPEVKSGTLTCAVRDSLGATASSSINYRFEAQQVYSNLVANAPYVSSSSGNCTVPAGQTTCDTWNVVSSAVSGGSGNYSYNWTVTDPSGIFTASANGQSSITITTRRASGTYYADVSYIVTDTTTGQSAQSPVTRVTVTHYAAAQPITVSISNINPSRSQNGIIPFGGNASFTWAVTASVSGGTGPYTYNWIPTTDIAGGTFWTVRSGTSASNPTTIDFITGSAGNYGHYFRCTVTDSLGATGYVDFDLAAVATVSCTTKTQTYTSSGSYTVTASDGNTVLIDAAGGGGGGGAGSQFYGAWTEWPAGSGGGGGGGGWVKDYPLSVNVGDVISFTIGSGGSGASNSPQSITQTGYAYTHKELRTLSGSVGGDTIIKINGATKLVLKGGGGGAGYWAATTYLTSSGGGNTGESCFPSGTKVLLADGSEKEIQQLLPGDLVLGKDGINEVLSNVTTKLGTNRKMYKDATRNLYWSGEHVFWTDNGWWVIDKTQLNAECYVSRGAKGLDWAETVLVWDNETFPAVQTINGFEKLNVELAEEIMQDPNTVLYDVQVSGCHTMYVNGCVAIAGAIFVIDKMEK